MIRSKEMKPSSKFMCAGAMVVLAQLFAAPLVRPAVPAATVTYAGLIVSATGHLPAELIALADCNDDRPRIVGKVRENRYELELPTGVRCFVMVGKRARQSHTIPVDDAATAVAQTVLVYPAEIPEPALARELIAMGRDDQALRGPHWRPDEPGFFERLSAGDSVRQHRLAEIIAANGWPTFSMVGAEAADDAWLIAQHASKAQLKAWLVLMREAGARHEIFLPNLATSIDRDLINDGKEQLYGTQYRSAGDVGDMLPVADIAHIDERRLAMGLPTLASGLAQIRRSQESFSERSPNGGN